MVDFKSSFVFETLGTFNTVIPGLSRFGDLTKALTVLAQHPLVFFEAV